MTAHPPVPGPCQCSGREPSRPARIVSILQMEVPPPADGGAETQTRCPHSRALTLSADKPHREGIS